MIEIIPIRELTLCIECESATRGDRQGRCGACGSSATWRVVSEKSSAGEVREREAGAEKARGNVERHWPSPARAGGVGEGGPRRDRVSVASAG